MALPPAAATAEHVRALLVESSAATRLMMQRVLNAALLEPIEVQLAVTARGAPEDLSGFRLALVDIDLVNHEALKLLCRLPCACWRVATTLNDDDDRLVQALRVGVHGVLLRQDRYERQVEGLQRILRGCPEVSPSLARRLLDVHKDQDELGPELERVLICRGKGSSLKEAALALNLSISEVQDLLTRVFARMRQPTASILERLDGPW